MQLREVADLAAEQERPAQKGWSPFAEAGSAALAVAEEGAAGVVQVEIAHLRDYIACLLWIVVSRMGSCSVAIEERRVAERPWEC